MSRSNRRRLKVPNPSAVVHDEFVLRQTESLIRKRYKSGCHHVACTLVASSGRQYHGLHVKNDGFDICAEPTALANAIYEGEMGFAKIVSYYWSGVNDQRPVVVAPCGNCLQILVQYAPDVAVAVPTPDGKVNFIAARELLPYAYRKPKST